MHAGTDDEVLVPSRGCLSEFSRAPGRVFARFEIAIAESQQAWTECRKMRLSRADVRSGKLSHGEELLGTLNAVVPVEVNSSKLSL